METQFDHVKTGPGARVPGKFPGEPLTDRATALALAFILGVVFLAYANTLGFDFVHDDRFQILGNTWLRSWKYLPRYFTADVWSFNHPVFRGTFYRPIFLVWFRLQYLVFGLSPWGWHLCTVLCHVGVTLLAYFTALRLLKDRLAALITTLFFGLHPTHVEGVAWISGVTEPLFALFLFAAYLYYLKMRGEAKRTSLYLAASLMLFLLAMLSKETAVVLPLVIFACEFLWSGPPSGSLPRNWFQRVLGAMKVSAPYFALVVVYLVARFAALKGFQNTKEAHSYLSMFLTWPSVLWFYVKDLFWPVRLNPFYTREFYTHVDWRHVLLPTIPVALAAMGLWLWSMRSRPAAAAVIWLIVPVLPVLDLRAFIEGHLVHDRYLYLPSFGFAMLVALALRRFDLGSRILGQPALQLLITGVIGLGMVAGIYQATACYADETKFFTYVTSMSPEGHSSQIDLAGLLGSQGHLEEAIRIYKEVYPSDPDNWDVNYNLGYAYYVTGKLPDADQFLSRAVAIDPTRPDGFFYLGLTKLKEHDLGAAAANVQRAVVIRPDADHYHFALGVIFKVQGNLPGALSEFQQEMDLTTDKTAAHQQAEEVQAMIAAGK